VQYHPGKANVVADTLSRKGHCNHLPAVHSMGEESSTRVLPDLSLFNITLIPTLRGEIFAAQKNDEGIGHTRKIIQEGDPKVVGFCEDAEGVLWFKDRLVVPRRMALKKKILDEAHTSRYSIHSSSTKMYHDLRQQLWWTRMKCETSRYVSECDTYQKVKVHYMKPGGLLQSLSILDWKWDDISMDFIVGLPLTARKYNSILVIVDRLTKNCSLHTCEYQLQRLEVCRNLHCSCAMLARSSKDDHFRSRVAVCRSLLEATARVPRDTLDSQFGLSPADGWPN
jgi:hypothetical protein